MTLPLAGLRVLAIEQYGAGPFGSSHLADLGAEVIKIEDPTSGGDVGRSVPPYQQDDDSLFFEAFNRGKKSISLDLALAVGACSVRGTRPGQRRGLLEPARRRPREDRASPTPTCPGSTRGSSAARSRGYGMTGPRRSDPGYDYVLQALTGWMDITGEPDGPPTKSGLSLVDFSAGYVAALALLAGIMGARRDGIGTDCDVSLFDTAMAMLTYPAVWHLNAGFEARRMRHSAHPSIVPFQAFETADGWIVVAAPKEKFWQRFTVVIEQPDLAEDPRFATLADRQRHSVELMAILEEVMLAAYERRLGRAAARRGGAERPGPLGRGSVRRPAGERPRSGGRGGAPALRDDPHDRLPGAGGSRERAAAARTAPG